MQNKKLNNASLVMKKEEKNNLIENNEDKDNANKNINYLINNKPNDDIDANKVSIKISRRSSKKSLIKNNENNVNFNTDNIKSKIEELT